MWCSVVWCGVVLCGVVYSWVEDSEWCGVAWCAQCTVTKWPWPGWSCIRVMQAGKAVCLSTRYVKCVSAGPRYSTLLWRPWVLCGSGARARVGGSTFAPCPPPPPRPPRCHAVGRTSFAARKIYLEASAPHFTAARAVGVVAYVAQTIVATAGGLEASAAHNTAAWSSGQEACGAQTSAASTAGLEAYAYSPLPPRLLV